MDKKWGSKRLRHLIERQLLQNISMAWLIQGLGGSHKSWVMKERIERWLE